MITNEIGPNGLLTSKNDTMVFILPPVAKQSVKFRTYVAMSTKSIDELTFLAEDKSRKVREALLFNPYLPKGIRSKVIASLRD